MLILDDKGGGGWDLDPSPFLADRFLRHFLVPEPYDRSFSKAARPQNAIVRMTAQITFLRDDSERPGLP